MGGSRRSLLDGLHRLPRCSTYFVIFGLLTCETSAVSRSCWRADGAIGRRRWIAVVGVRKTRGFFVYSVKDTLGLTASDKSKAALVVAQRAAYVVESSFWKRCRGLIAWSAPHARRSDPDSHKSIAPRCVAARRARPPLHRFPAYAGAACELLARHRSTASTPSPRRAPPRPQTTACIPKHCCETCAMKTNAHNFIHACHMNTVCVVIVLAKLIRAPVSSRRRPPLCYPSSAFSWPQSVVKAGGERRRGCICLTARERPPAAPS